MSTQIHKIHVKIVLFEYNLSERKFWKITKNWEQRWILTVLGYLI